MFRQEPIPELKHTRQKRNKDGDLKNTVTNYCFVIVCFEDIQNEAVFTEALNRQTVIKQNYPQSGRICNFNVSLTIKNSTLTSKVIFFLSETYNYQIICGVADI